MDLLHLLIQIVSSMSALFRRKCEIHCYILTATTVIGFYTFPAVIWLGKRVLMYTYRGTMNLKEVCLLVSDISRD